ATVGAGDERHFSFQLLAAFITGADDFRLRIHLGFLAGELLRLCGNFLWFHQNSRFAASSLTYAWAIVERAVSNAFSSFRFSSRSHTTRSSLSAIAKERSVP